MRVPVDATIMQVTDGSHYKGVLKIVDVKFNYDLKFAYPIPRLNNMTIPEDTEGLRKLVKISVKRSKIEIVLEDREYDMFLSMILYLALTFYDDPKTRTDQKGIKGVMVRGEGPLGRLGLRITIGMRSKGYYELPHELCEMLKSPKFGCTLV